MDTWAGGLEGGPDTVFRGERITLRRTQGGLAAPDPLCERRVNF